MVLTWQKTVQITQLLSRDTPTISLQIQNSCIKVTSLKVSSLPNLPPIWINKKVPTGSSTRGCHSKDHQKITKTHLTTNHSTFNRLSCRILIQSLKKRTIDRVKKVRTTKWCLNNSFLKHPTCPTVAKLSIKRWTWALSSQIRVRQTLKALPPARSNQEYKNLRSFLRIEQVHSTEKRIQPRQSLNEVITR